MRRQRPNGGAAVALAGAAVVLAIASCGGSPGTLVNPRRDPGSFVTEKLGLLVETGGGVMRINLDGSGRETLAPATVHLVDATPDGAVIVVEDSDTNVYVVDGTRQVRQIHELDLRSGAVAIRPDGKVIAIAKHADFSLPQASWGTTEDDAIYMVDVATLAVEVIPKTRDELVTRIAWLPGGNSVVLGMFHFDNVKLDVVKRTREVMPGWPQVVARSAGTERCDRTGETIAMTGWKGDGGFDIVDAHGGVRHLVTITGRSRGFHDYQSTIESAVFTPSCRYVVFEYERAVWVAEVATGTVGHVISGGAPRLLVTPVKGAAGSER